MTEAEWLSSDDPAAMLAYVNDWLRTPGQIEVSDRKLRLFACAVSRLVYGRLSRSPMTGIEDADGIGGLKTDIVKNRPHEFALYWAEYNHGPAFTPRKADILREIVGNPFSPTIARLREFRPMHDWLTWNDKAVYRLAGAAYAERGRKCGACAKAERGFNLSGGVPGCPSCRGTGTIDDGTLDNARLAVLSDAMEEAGCPGEVAQHTLRVGDVVESSAPTNPLHCGSGIYRHAVVVSLDPFALVAEEGDMMWTATRTPLDVRPARRTGVNVERAMARWEREKGGYRPDGKWPASLPHPLLAHLRSRGPHYRGCWAIDLILGKE